MLEQKLFSSLLTVKSNENLYAKLVDQLNKDFGQISFFESFEKDNSPKTLVNKLHFNVRKLIDDDFSILLSLLYRIDVSEEQLNSTLTNQADNIVEAIVILILKRESEKILLRSRFK